jgi:putative phosphoesterase
MGSDAVLRVAIVSDTHGRLDPRIAEVVAGCDLVVHAGDIGSAAVLGGLRPRGGRVAAVTGNNDIPSKWPEPDRVVLATLPREVEIDLPGGRLKVIHGHQTPARGRHRWLRDRYAGFRAVVYGHSHRMAIDRVELPWILNPGAAGRSRTFGGPSCLVLTASRAEWGLEEHRFRPRGEPRIAPLESPTIGSKSLLTKD